MAKKQDLYILECNGFYMGTNLYFMGIPKSRAARLTKGQVKSIKRQLGSVRCRAIKVA
jgi:hypothetical protein